MYSQTPQVGGAEAPKRSLEPVLRDVVVAFLRLSSEEKDRLDSYDNEDCHSALQELVDYANNPTAEQQAQIAQLQGENASLQGEAQRAQAEFDQEQEDLDLLRAEVRSAQRRAELKHGEDRPGQSPPLQHKGGRLDDSKRSLTRELGASRSPCRHVDRTPSPLPRGRSCAYCYSDPSDSGSSESDGQQSYHSRGLRTQQLESLAKDIERFDRGLLLGNRTLPCRLT
ncbi:hypothetical protein ABVT39_026649 [Epinephelus coioides]